MSNVSHYSADVCGLGYRSWEAEGYESASL